MMRQDVSKKSVLQRALLLCVIVPGIAVANINTDSRTLSQDAKQQIGTQKTAIAAFSTLSRQSVQHNLTLVNHIVQRASQGLTHRLPHAGGKAADGVILFISFSMPDALILQMSQQAAAFHASVVIRGLVKNSFPKTLQRILSLKLQAKKAHSAFAGVGIDPVWFSQFNITAVPALVVTHRPAHCVSEHQCPDQPYDVIYGNQAIADSLHEMARSGSAPIRPIAQRLLADAGGDNA